MDSATEERYIAALRKASAKLKELSAAKQPREPEPVAVLGIGCRFPGGANTPDEFWQMLERGVDAIGPVPVERWDVDSYYDSDPEAPGKMYTRAGGFLESVDGFDEAFFSISPKEAEAMDPQQRLALEVSWEAFEHAGINVRSLRATRTGVFLGLSNYDYIQSHIHSGDPSRITQHSGSGVMFSTAAGRLSYTYDFRGPCITVDTACSSSLTALHLAMQSLQSGESELALAGGVSLLLSPDSYVALCKVKALSADGRCHTFAANAQGYGRGEGCGFVVLKRFSAAIAANDRILAVLKGTAVNHDGRSNGLTAPNGPAQQAVIRESLERAGVDFRNVSYVEAHGTGTALGDPIEVNSLVSVFGPGRPHKLLLGSVKTNIGHTEAAAGIAGVIKTVLALGHGRLPASLHFDEPNTNIEWSTAPVEVVASLRDWPRGDVLRTAGVSSFGLSGTNAHVVIQEAPERRVPSDDSEYPGDVELLVASGATPKALDALIARYASALDMPRGTAFGDFCASSRIRVPLPHRIAAIAPDHATMAEALRSGTGILRRKSASTARKGVVFLFAGQGSQYSGMGAQLYREHPVFRKAIDYCGEILQSEMPVRLSDCILGTVSAQDIDQTSLAQPALCAIEYALTQLWATWGVHPAAVLGHSVGEFAAAWAAGVFPIETALRLTAARGRIMQTLAEAGAMAAVFASEEEVRGVVGEDGSVWVAGYNAPRCVTISGRPHELEAVLPALRARGIESRKLRTSHAFHSPLVAPAIAQFAEAVTGVDFSNTSLPFFSTLTGGSAAPSDLKASSYWAEQIARPVRFRQALEAARANGFDTFLEIGPDSALASLSRQTLPVPESLAIASLRPREGNWRSMLSAAGELFVHGVDLEWEQFPMTTFRHRVDIPFYPFQRRRHWLDVAPRRSIEQAIKMQTNIPNHNLTGELRDLLGESGGFRSQDLNPSQNLMEMGFDSLLLVKVAQRIQARWGVEIAVSRFFQDLTCLDQLAAYVEEHRRTPGESAPEAITRTSSVAIVPQHSAPRQMQNGSSAVLSLFEQQTESLSRMANQNLHALSELHRQQLMSLGTVSAPSVHPVSLEPVAAPDPPRQKSVPPTANFRGLQLGPARALTPEKRAAIDAIVRHHVARTPGSRSHTQNSREYLADWKHTLSFWGQLKEAKYPIISARSEGAYFWDVDGNRYIDIAMGMGVHFFGHTPPFIADALRRQIDEGTELGTQCDLTGEVARLIHELTGLDRVAFTNTGTEAVMVALRLARAATKRNRVIIFKGSYHGIFDGVLAAEADGVTVPVGLGTPSGMVQDVDVLEYDSPESLDRISSIGDSLAAVLVEPVQSRHPDLQPQAFLRELRRITEEKGIALIFDEMITGFRIGAGGAQAWFGIQADIATYGKIAGGGLPIGVIAGRARFLDYIDGGVWQYGDRSMPKAEMIFFGGTFARNPMTMAAAHAALTHIVAHGSEIYASLNARTASFCDRLNLWLERERAPIRAEHFASQWRLAALGAEDTPPVELELLYLLLMGRGVYTWERRINFFSAAHTEADFDHVENAIRQSILEIRRAGFEFSLPEYAPAAFSAPSSVHRRLYAVSQRGGGDLAYHLPQCFRVDGPLDVRHLEDCFVKIIRRHESLRTAFTIVDGELVLKVVAEPRFHIERRACGEEGINFAALDFCRPFDLAEPPLLRVAIVEGQGGHRWLLADAHHLAVDGLSFNVVASELITLYSGATLPPVPCSLQECLQIQASIRAKAYEAGLEFWRAELAGPLPVLDLPADHFRPPAQAFCGRRIPLRIEPSATLALREAARQTGSSLFIALLAAYNILLHRLTGQEDILVGGPVAGRSDPKLENAVAMLVNTIVYRNRPAGGLTVRGFLDSVRRVSAAVYAHQDFAFEDLAQLDTSRPRDRNPVFDTLLSYEDASARSFRMRDLQLHRMDFAAPASMFDLSVDILEESGVLLVEFVYRSDLYDADSIGRWAGCFRRILENFGASLDAKIGDLELCSDTEAALIKTWNDTAASYPHTATVVSLFEEQARRTPGAVALISGTNKITYQELDERASRIAGMLVSVAGVGTGDFVAMLLDRSIDMIASILAVLKTGAAYVPIDVEYPAAQIGWMVEDCRAKAVLAEARYAGLVPGSAKARTIEITSASAAGFRRPVAGPTPDDIAYVIYTSGSTGKPKGCLVTHRNVVRLLKNDRFDFDFGPEDVWIAAHSFSFDFSVWEMYGALLYGGKLVIPHRAEIRDPKRLRELVRSHQVTILNQTPGAFYGFIEAERPAPDHSLDGHLRCVIFGGDRLEPAFLRDWVDLYPLERIRLINMFGITETTVHVTHGLLSKTAVYDGKHARSIGRPLPETRVYICNSHLREQPIGVLGELYVGGSGVSKGYLNRIDLTRERFLPSPFVSGEILYRTGDIGRWRPDGDIEYWGRNDQQVEIRGYRIETLEVEHALLECPGVLKAHVMARTAGQSSELLAYLVTSSPVNAGALRAQLGSILPDCMIPAHFVRIDAMPLSSNGKLNVDALPRPERNSIDAGEEFIAPANETEAQIAAVWREVLERERVGARDSYFALGGDSIRATQVVSRLRKIGLRLRVRDILEHPTIRQLAALANVGGSGGTSVEPAKEVKLTPIQVWFFENHLTGRAHFNQAALLRSKTAIAPEAARRASAAVFALHDSLRLCIVATGNSGLRQTVMSNAPVPFQTCDLRSSIRPLEELEEHAGGVQGAFDLASGCLVRFVHYRLPDGDRMLIVAHHLAVDGVSWRIILDDWREAYARALASSEIALAPAAASWLSWAQALHQYAKSPELLKEVAFWAAVEAQTSRPSLVRSPRYRYGQSRTREAGLTEEETKRLIEGVAAQGVELYHVLVAGAVLALGQCRGGETLEILLEGHGREDVAGLELHRTTGWFTSIFPLKFHLPSSDPSLCLAAVRQTLNSVPNKGIGYGVLRYLTARELVPGLSFAPLPEISFNYLGHFAAQLDEQFSISGEFTGPLQAASLERGTLLDLEAMLLAGELRLSASFVPEAWPAEEVERLLVLFRQEVLRVGCASEGIAEIEEITDLTPMQEGMVFHALEPNSRAYFEQFSYRIEARLDPLLFEAAWNAVARRHPALRSCFRFSPGQAPQQIVYRHCAVPFLFEDLRGAGHAEIRISEYRAADCQRGFDLEKGPLARVALFRLNDVAFEVVWSHHHAILDGWSVGILHRDLALAYNALLAGSAAPLPAVAIRPSAFTQWLRRRDQSESRNFWRAYLEDAEASTLPRIAAEGGYLLMEEVFFLPEDDTKALVRLATHHNVTLNSVVLAIWAILLGYYAGRRDVVFGIVLSGRPPELPGVEDVAGLFLQSIPLRVRWMENHRFEDVLGEVQRQLLACQEHQYLPLAEIQMLTGANRPAFDHVVVFENYPVDEAAGSALGIAGVSVLEQMHYDFSLVVHPGTRLELKITANARAFPAEFARQVLAEFHAIGTGALRRPEIPASILFPIAPVSAVEPASLPANSPTVLDLFEKSALAHPGRTAIEYGAASISYLELDDRAAKLAVRLISGGLQRGGRVGVFLPNSDAYIVAILAIQKSGGVFIPLDVASPKLRLRAMIEITQPCILLANEASRKNLSEAAAGVESIASRIITFEDDAVYPMSPSFFDASRVHPPDDAYVMFTSGSTGEPKAILGGHDGLAHFIEWELREFNLDSSARVSNLALTTFDVSLRDIFVPLASGGTICIPSPEARGDIGRLVEWLAASRVTLIHIVPSVFRLLLKELEAVPVPARLDSLRYVLLAGEPLFGKDIVRARAFMPRRTEFVNVYGPSETTLAKAFYRIPESLDQPERILPIGKPIDGTSIRILKENQLAGPGAIGEICISPPFRPRGYFNDPSLTAARFVRDPLSSDPDAVMYRTGDLGRQTLDGLIESLGRIDRQVKLRGVRVELGEIDAAMLAVPGIEQTIAVIRNRAGGDANNADAALVSYYTGPRPLDPVELRAQLAERLPSSLMPEFLLYLEEFPLNVNGKIDARALPKPEELVHDRYPYEPPAGAAEERIAAIWRETLGINRVGVNTPFLDAGGNSLTALRVISWVNRELHVSLTIRSFFELSTIRNIARMLAVRSAADWEAISRQPDQPSYPLSHSQKRLWMAERLSADTSPYNLPSAMLLEGPLNIRALESAFRALVDRHESLRTAIREIGGEPRQVISPISSFTMPVLDLRGRPDAEQLARTLAEEDARRPFDLRFSLLLRVLLLQLDPLRHILLFNIHHIVSDASSVSVILEEIAELYAAFDEGRDPRCRALRIQYRDFAVWQNAFLESKAGAQRQYWHANLAPPLPVPQFPADRPPSAVMSFTGARIERTIPAAVVSRLAEMGRECGATLFTVLVAAVQAFLHRYTRQEDIVIGTAVTNRDNPDLVGQIGFYVNIVGLRGQVRGDHSFLEQLLAAKQTVANALENAAYPFDRLLQELSVTNGQTIDASSLFDVFLVLQSDRQKSPALRGLRVSEWYSDTSVAKFPLALEFVELPSLGLCLNLEYQTSRFDRWRVEALAGHLISVLESISRSPQTAIGAFPLVGEAETQRLLTSASSASPVSGGTVADWFEDTAREYASKTAVIFEGKTLNYAELNARANRLARELSARGIHQGDFVGVLLQRSELMPIAFMGVLKAGAVYVPMDPSYPADRLHFMRSDSVCRALVVDSATAGDHLAIDLGGLECAEETNPVRNLSPSDLAYVIYTSGSTGRPKGVLIEHRGATNLASFLRSSLGIEPRHQVLQFAPAAFDASVWEMAMALLTGATLVIAGRDRIEDIANFSAYIRENGVTVATLPPSYCSQLPAEAFGGLEILITAGEPPNIQQALELSRSLRYINAYGPTEATVCATWHQLDSGAGQIAPIPIGRPIPNCQVLLLDPYRNLVPVGVVGEIYLGGRGISRGYLNRDDLTSAGFVPHPFAPGERLFRTGDLGVWRPDGLLEFAGRFDTQVKVAGNRVELGEIDSCLCEYPAVRQAAVLLRADGPGGSPALIAFVASEKPLEEEKLRSHLDARLPGYMLPARFVHLQSLPLTPNGKVDRRQLANWPLPEAAGVTAPHNNFERIIADVWRELLGCSVGREDNFFKLGADSIRCIQAVDRLRQAGITLKVRDLQESPSISALSRRFGELLPGVSTGGAGASKTPAGVSADLERVALSSAEFDAVLEVGD